MARMKFLCDAERCIECNGCVTACKQENEVPWGVNRRRVVTLNDGIPGEKSMSVACMPDFDTSGAQFWPPPSNGAGLRALSRQNPRYMDCCFS